MLQHVMTVSDLRLHTVIAPVILPPQCTLYPPEHPHRKHPSWSLQWFIEDKSIMRTGVNEHFKENGELK